MLETLAKKDEFWRKVSLNICKDKELADDIVQEMYIKLCDSKKELNDYYVIIVIRNLFIDRCKKKRTANIEDYSFLSVPQEETEADDHDREIIINLKWWEKEIITMCYDHSQREVARILNINYGFVHRVVKKARTKWEDQKNNQKD